MKRFVELNNTNIIILLTRSLTARNNSVLLYSTKTTLIIPICIFVINFLTISYTVRNVVLYSNMFSVNVVLYLNMFSV